MTLAIQTNRELLAPWTETQFISSLMAALKSAGFPDPAYDYHPAADSGTNRYLIYEFVGDATKAKGRLYLRIRWTINATTGAISLYSALFDSWSIANRVGTNIGTEILCAVAPVPTSPISFYSFSHPEMNYVALNQGGASGNWGFLNFVRPAIKVILNSVTLFDEQQYPYGFIGSSADITQLSGCASALSPTADASYPTMYLAQLAYRTNLLNRNQRLPAPYVLSGNSQGAVCQFSADIAIAASNGMPWLAEINQGSARNVLLMPRTASGLTLSADPNIVFA